ETGKSSLSIHFAATGAFPKQSEVQPQKYGFLLVNFDEPLSDIPQIKINDKFYYSIDVTDDKLFEGILQESKGHIRKIILNKGNNNFEGYELWLTPGYLLPEEFVYFLYQILRAKEQSVTFSRVIFRDVGELPMRQPILAQKILSGGSNYIPVILELLKRMCIDCMFVCSVDSDDNSDRSSKAIERGLSSIAHFRIQAAEEPRSFTLKGRLIKGDVNISLK
ncbi:hypothetical protein JW926_17085, partial [Candidatus Sumerlaeota bacterium]|nr:hypothetical protein [Candidatus Sumerlaeota bacterium]